MTIQSELEAIGSAINSVTGLRVQTRTGAANTPGAVIELGAIRTPITMGGKTTLIVRILLLVQQGDFRNCLERIYALVDPSGTTATSVMAALLGYAAAGDIEFDMGAVEYAGTTYGGGVFTCEVYTS